MRLTSLGSAVPTAMTGARQPAEFRLSGWQAMLVALAGGLALATAFPPAGFWPLAAAGPALLAIALWRQRLRTALAAGAAFGLAFYLPLLSWLVNLAWYVWVALVVAETLILVALTVGQWLLLRLRAWPLAVAGWWVTAEAVRDRLGWGGFPWGRLAMSQASSPALHWVAIGGPVLLTFLIALTGACLAWLILGSADGSRGSASGGRRRWLAGAGLAVTAALTVSGPLLPVDGGASAPAATVAAIQGDVPHARHLPDLWRATRVTQNQAAATDLLAARVRAGRIPPPDLVIWPENSTDQDPSLNPFIAATIASAVQAVNRPVLVGAVLQNPVRNAGQLWLPGKGPVAVYIKRRLVPFGEVIPFRGLLAKITNLPSTLQPVDFTAGHRPVVFRIGNIRLGDVICYEVGFDGLVSSEVKAGANLLTMQTNDADFELDGQTGETLQQLAMARVRAAEHNRAVVVASTTGVSAIIGPGGALLATTHTWTRAVIEARVPLRSSLTLADRLGGWPEVLLTGVTAAALARAAGVSLARRRRRSKAAAGPAAE